MRRMTISMLQRIAQERLPIRIEGSEGVDSVRILAMAGHVLADVAAPVRTPLGWLSESAIVRAVTPAGRRMLRVRFPAQHSNVRRRARRRRSPSVIGLTASSFAAAGFAIELLRRAVA